MKKLLLSILFLIATLCVNCKKLGVQKKDSHIVTEFPKKLVLKSEKLLIPSKAVKISEFSVIDSYLIIYQGRKEVMFSIYKLPTLKHLKDFGTKGNGPNEFKSVFGSTFRPVHGGKSTFAVANKSTNIQYYNIEDLLINNFKPYKVINLPPKLGRFMAITYVGDSLIYGAPYNQENIDLFKFNSNSNSLNTLLEYPNDFPLMNSENRRNVYGSYLATKSDNTKFTRTYDGSGTIEIFDINKDKPFTITYKDFPTLKENLQLNKTSKRVKNFTQTKIFSWGIRANDKYIYVSIYNTEYYNVADKKGLKQSFIPEIHVFDWSGKPIAICKLDSNFISFDVDKEGEYLYTSSEFEGNTIRRYKISRIDEKN